MTRSHEWSALPPDALVSISEAFARDAYDAETEEAREIMFGRMARRLANAIATEHMKARHEANAVVCTIEVFVLSADELYALVTQMVQARLGNDASECAPS